MIRRRRAPESPRIVFAGRRCDLSAIPLQGLIQDNIDVVACLIPARRLPGHQAEPLRLVPPSKLRRLPLLAITPTTSIDQITSEQQIPLYEITDAHNAPLVSLLRTLQPDVLVVSCFPWKVSDEILAIPRHGAINVHPSLLPRHRGPGPLFWTFQQGEAATGVSIHQMTTDLDAGPLFQQVSLPLPAAADGQKVEQRLARLAASILPDILRKLASSEVATIAQDECMASYEGWPEDDDLCLSRDWTVERVLRFVSGVVSLGYLPTVEIDGAVQEIESALAETDLVGDSSDNASLVRVNFADGAVWLRLAGTEDDVV